MTNKKWTFNILMVGIFSLTIITFPSLAKEDLQQKQYRLKKYAAAALNNMDTQTLVCNRIEELKPKITAKDLKGFDRESAATVLLYTQYKIFALCIQQQENDYLRAMLAYAGSFPQEPPYPPEYQAIIHLLLNITFSAGQTLADAEGRYLAVPKDLRDKMEKQFNGKVLDMHVFSDYYENLEQSN